MSTKTTATEPTKQSETTGDYHSTNCDLSEPTAAEQPAESTKGNLQIRIRPQIELMWLNPSKGDTHQIMRSAVESHIRADIEREIDELERRIQRRFDSSLHQDVVEQPALAASASFSDWISREENTDGHRRKQLERCWHGAIASQRIVAPTAEGEGKAAPNGFTWEYHHGRRIALSNGSTDVLVATGDDYTSWLDISDENAQIVQDAFNRRPSIDPQSLSADQCRAALRQNSHDNRADWEPEFGIDAVWLGLKSRILLTEQQLGLCGSHRIIPPNDSRIIAAYYLEHSISGSVKEDVK